MQKIFLCLLLLGFSQVGFGEEKRPSVDSIKELLTVTQVKSLFESTFDQMNGYLQGIVAQSFDDQEMNEEQQKKAQFLQQEVMALVKKELNWDVLEAMYLDIYSTAFNQSEIDSILSFYKSEGGQAVLNKMPILMQNIMAHMQNQMKNVLSKVEELQEKISD